MIEVWKDIERYEGLYQVSNTGKVKSLKRILKFDIGRKGYYRTSLCKEGFIRKYLVHRLVAIMFIPNPLNLPQVNHLDGDKSNNNDWNLEWSSASDNVQHALNIGLRVPIKGINHYEAKFKESDILKIRNLYKGRGKGPTQKEIGILYNVPFQTISRIILNKTWKHITRCKN